MRPRSRRALARARRVDGGQTAFGNDNRLTYTYGSAAAHIAVDPGTGDVELLDCLVVEDVGRIVNPLTLHGQAIGGMVQGLGGAFLEHLVYDSNGQLLSGNLADYLIPTATDFPNIRAIALENHRSPSNPLGVKGAGEGSDHPDRRPDGQRPRQRRHHVSQHVDVEIVFRKRWVKSILPNWEPPQPPSRKVANRILL
jgi:hypothetical protein